MSDRQKQLLLAYLGYYRGAIDGIWGTASGAAEEAFRKDHMTQSTGTSDFTRRLREVVAAAEPEAEGDFWQEIRYFRREEFRCRCGSCGGFPAEPEEKLIRAADALRKILNSPVLVSSGVRCAAHNGAVGGVSNSRHLAGKAMDLCSSGYSAAQLLETIRRLPGIRYAYAIDENYVHMDIL